MSVVVMRLLACLLAIVGSARASQGGNDPVAKPVLVEVYYESLCPDSRKFLMSQLYPTWEALNGTGKCGQITNCIYCVS
jgi:hypothetical protein